VKPKENAGCENSKRCIVIDASNVAMTYKNYLSNESILSIKFYSQNLFLNLIAMVIMMAFSHRSELN